ncbi:hypothetical protein FNF29_05808 [Cafeteria roenbergensis]|uniref:Uncharacterized protein n=1 Tax=Cafeteria roenbergensis TaxID=33653 RepID=A0A5A8C901_CAFRO|nr:hypothetical protein FNF29_05808 [Cafeteria roenbergensis]|eukprot:KAA0149596.1 hypothetical protein FNF29_05808 [Cafeteria roenbergensis]
MWASAAAAAAATSGISAGAPGGPIPGTAGGRQGARTMSLSDLDASAAGEGNMLGGGWDAGWPGTSSAALQWRGPSMVSSFRALPEAVDGVGGPGLVLGWQPWSGLMLAAGNAPLVRVWDVTRSQCVATAQTASGGMVTTMASAWPGNGVAMLGHANGAISLIDHRVPAAMASSAVGSAWDASAAHSLLRSLAPASSADAAASMSPWLSQAAAGSRFGAAAAFGLGWRGLASPMGQAALRAVWSSSGAAPGSGAAWTAGSAPGGVATVLRLGTSEGTAGLLGSESSAKWRRGVTSAHQRWVVRVAQPKGGAWFEAVSGGLSGEVAWWDLRRTVPVRSVQAFTTPLTAMAVHDWTRSVAVGTQDQKVLVFGPGGAEGSHSRRGGGDADTSALPPGHPHASGAGAPRQTLKHLAGFLGQRIAPVTALEYHPHDPVLAVGGTNNLVAMFSAGWIPAGGLGDPDTSGAGIQAAAVHAAHHLAASEAAAAAMEAAQAAESEVNKALEARRDEVPAHGRSAADRSPQKGRRQAESSSDAVASRARTAAAVANLAYSRAREASLTAPAECGAQWGGVVALRAEEWVKLGQAGCAAIRSDLAKELSSGGAAAAAARAAVGADPASGAGDLAGRAAMGARSSSIASLRL